jgi:CBS domain-containing protein
VAGLLEDHPDVGLLAGGVDVVGARSTAARTHAVEAAPRELGGGKAAGVAGGAVQDDRHRRDDTVALVRINEVMTQGVVTAETGDSLRRVGELMRDRNVGSVVICEGGRPVGVITDRDLALVVVADDVTPDGDAGEHASRPLVTGEVEMDIEEAVALMVQHRIRRLPVTSGEDLVGIVTIDDLAVRAGDLHQAQQITAEVAKAALPEFYFHQRGG